MSLSASFCLSLSTLLHDLHDILVGEDMIFPHPLRLVLHARPPHPGILKGTYQSAMNAVAEILDGGMVGMEDDLEEGGRGGTKKGRMEGGECVNNN